jgi:hypothetical protein
MLPYPALLLLWAICLEAGFTHSRRVSLTDLTDGIYHVAARKRKSTVRRENTLGSIACLPTLPG